MKKPTLLYIPLFILFALSLSVLAVHWSKTFKMYDVASSQIEMPTTANREVMNLTPEAEQAGIKLNDRLVAINERKIENGEIYFEEVAKVKPGEILNLTFARTNSAGQTENVQISYQPPTLEKDFAFFSRLVAGFLYAYVLPTLCILLGFYVALVRPKDFLAWMLLFMLLGFSSIGLESHMRNTLVGFYNSIFFGSWALSMFLFALYFPERWNFDRRFPWANGF